jgi:hypothetical protein
MPVRVRLGRMEETDAGGGRAGRGVRALCSQHGRLRWDPCSFAREQLGGELGLQINTLTIH